MGRLGNTTSCFSLTSRGTQFLMVAYDLACRFRPSVQFINRDELCSKENVMINSVSLKEFNTAKLNY